MTHDSILGFHGGFTQRFLNAHIICWKCKYDYIMDIAKEVLMGKSSN
jgi:hypothetical protein